MLKTRIAPAIALAIAVGLGTTGCGLFVPQATTMKYAPSDGIDVDLPNVDVRNLMLVANKEEANLVFTAVNRGDTPNRITIKFVDEKGTQLTQGGFMVEPGLHIFGVDPQELLPLQGLMVGSMITTFIESDGVEIERAVPVLDDTLVEYADLMPR